MNGHFAIEQLTGRVKKYWLEGLDYQQGFSWHNQVLRSDTYVNKSTNKTANQNGLLSIDLVDVGVELKALSLQPDVVFMFQQQRWQGKLSVITGQAFNGEFSIDELEWPIAQEQTLALSFDGFDLSELIALENQQGINVTGQVSGQVPLYVAEKEGKLELSISDGNLFNITNGLIQIKDNPAVEQFKLNYQQLAIAFEALENLHYNQLSAQVNMDSQGQMLLATSIKGRNPDLDNEVNLNLNLDYDLLGLLESLQIPEQLEQRISDRLSNAKVN
nr:YdbH domain-containing protein [Endozoicomonas sp. G2_1]